MDIIEGGRYCDQCSKNVIDFSSYSNDAIIDYFIANKGKSICGRMKKSQLSAIEIDRHLLDHNISFWKKFLIIFLIVFGYELFGASFVFAQVVENDSLKKVALNESHTDTAILTSNVFDSAGSPRLNNTDSIFLIEDAIAVEIDTAKEKANVADKLILNKLEALKYIYEGDSSNTIAIDGLSMVLGGMGLESVDIKLSSMLEPFTEGKLGSTESTDDLGDGKRITKPVMKNIEQYADSKKEKDTPDNENQNDSNLSFILPDDARRKKLKPNMPI